MARTRLSAGGAAVAALVAGGVWLAIAAASDASPTGKSGGSAVVTLELAVAEYPGRAAGQAAERFARAVDERSNGSLRVGITYWPTRMPIGTPSGRVEADVVKAVRSDRVQLAILPAYALTDAGTSTLRALQAPFVLTSSGQTVRATQPPLAGRLLGGLGPLGLEGLALLPDGQVRAFGFLKALVTPADFDGITIRAPSSPAIRNALRALGARPVDLSVRDVDTAVFGSFANDAQSLPSATDEFPRNVYTAADEALFPRVDVVAASSTAVSRLRPGQREILRRAAGDARAGTIAAGGERLEAEAFCRAGGTIVGAPPWALAALRARTTRYLASLQSDPAVRSLIASFSRLAPSAGGGPPRCATPPPSDVSTADNHQYTPEEVKALFPPPGTYRRAFSVEDLRDAGADETDVRRNAALTTLTLYGQGWDQRFVIEWQAPVRRPPCRGRVWLVNRRIQLRWNPATPCGGLVRLSWKRASHGDLTVTRVDRRSEPSWIRTAYLGTWKRVDCTTGCGAREKLSATEVIELMKRQKPRGTRFVSCHHVLDSKWDYECSYWHLDRDSGNLVPTRFGVDVDESRVIRRGPA